MPQKSDSFKDWQSLYQKETKKSPEEKIHTTLDGLPLKPLYTSEDLKARGYAESMPGLSPFVRGPKASMYTGRPWTIRQYAGFSTAEESNRFYKECLGQGQKGLSVAFDLPTHRGYDSDNPRVTGDVGKAGVAIDSVEDMKILFRDIPLDKMSVSMTMNGACIPIMAAFIVAAEEAGYPRNILSGTIQNDILKEYMVRNTYIYPPEPSMRIVSDIIAYCSHNMPKFNSISISGYHIQEAGAAPMTELALTIADGIEYVKAAMARGLAIDDFAPRLSFFFGIGMSFYTEIAKLRAARLLWAEAMQKMGAKKPESLMLRFHCQTSGYTLTEQDPYNNIIRTTVEAMSAALGGTQSLHTNSFDEATCLPTDLSSRIARNTQIILQEETDITKTVDPFGGSYFMESLTLDLAEKAREIMAEIEKHGGMVKSILSGYPKMKIEESAAIKQARIDSKIDTIVGVNRYQVAETLSQDVREIDARHVLKEQLEGLSKLRKHRDEKAVKESLTNLEAAARSADGNLLESAIDAIKMRATVGEVSSALENVWGRYDAKSIAVSAVYSQSFKDSKKIEEIRNRCQAFFEKTGRRPRILVAKIGQDGHDRGAHVIVTGFADLGFDVDVGSLFKTPEEVAKQAIENDVHIVGVSSQAGGHKVLVPELIRCLKKLHGDDVVVVVGGIIPHQDYQMLQDHGVASVFGPGTPITDSAEELLGILEAKFA